MVVTIRFYMTDLRASKKSRAQPTLDLMVEIVMKDHLPLLKTAI